MTRVPGRRTAEDPQDHNPKDLNKEMWLMTNVTHQSAAPPITTAWEAVEVVADRAVRLQHEGESHHDQWDRHVLLNRYADQLDTLRVLLGGMYPGEDAADIIERLAVVLNEARHRVESRRAVTV